MERTPAQFARQGIRLREVARTAGVSGDRSAPAGLFVNLIMARDLDIASHRFDAKSENRLQSPSQSAEHTSQTVQPVSPTRFQTTPPTLAA
jgi:hypothetical protein